MLWRELSELRMKHHKQQHVLNKVDCYMPNVMEISLQGSKYSDSQLALNLINLKKILNMLPFIIVKIHFIICLLVYQFIDIAHKQFVIYSRILFISLALCFIFKNPFISVALCFIFNTSLLSSLTFMYHFS